MLYGMVELLEFVCQLTASVCHKNVTGVAVQDGSRNDSNVTILSSGTISLPNIWLNVFADLVIVI
jgi:hypothetical protein